MGIPLEKLEWEVLSMEMQLIKRRGSERDLSPRGLVYLIVGVMVILSLPSLRYLA